MHATFDKGGVWSIRVAALHSLKSFCVKANTEKWTTEMTSSIVSSVFAGMEDAKYYSVRSAALEVLLGLVERGDAVALWAPLHFTALLNEVKRLSRYFISTLT